MKTLNLLMFVCLSLAFACGPAGSDKESDANSETDMANDEMATDEETAEVKSEPAMARAIISGASDSEVTGEAVFTDMGDGQVTFKLTISNATEGTHAVHLHQNGDCSAPDAKSAGGHWNPEDVKHGKRGDDMKFHSGDIDNLEVGADGTGTLEMTVQGWSVGGSDSTNVINKAVIVHASADDFESQPSGAAGARIGCGVIEKVM